MLSLSYVCSGSSRIVAVATTRRGGAFVWGSVLSSSSSSSATIHPRYCSSFIRAFPSSSSPTHNLHQQQHHQPHSILVRYSSHAQSSSSAVEGNPAAVEPTAAAAAAADAEAGEASPSPMLAPKRARPRRTVTGGLKNLPVCPPANELLNRALRISKWLKIDEEKVKNQRLRARKLGALQLDTLTKGISKPLKETLKAYEYELILPPSLPPSLPPFPKQIDEEKVKNQRLRARKLGALQLDTLTKGISKPLKETLKAYEYELAVLHPFEATLADLTVRARAKQGHQTLPEVLFAVNELRKSVLETGKHYAGAAKNASSKAEAIALTEEGFREVEHLVLSNSEVVLNLIEVQKALRKIPIVQLGTPTVVLVGAPNVGKSSIVRAISSGTPEVNNYPFTTRGMTLGHVTYDDWASEKCQVMDTPGVLNRPDGERNEMEALTLASMQHLPTAVMFVLDLTGNSGALSSIENQIQIRNDLRARFPKRPWVDVISKADLPMDEADPAVARAPEGAIRVSTEDGTGLVELEARVREMLGDVREVLAVIGLREKEEAMGGGMEGGGAGGEGR